MGQPGMQGGGGGVGNNSGAQMGDQMGGGGAGVHPNSNLNRQSGQGGSTGSAPELREYNGGNNNPQMGGNMQHMMGQHNNQIQSGLSSVSF